MVIIYSLNNISDVDNTTNFILPVEGEKDKFVVGTGQNLLLVTWDGKSDKVAKVDTLATIDDPNGGTINDSKADARGRLWFGTISPKLDATDFSKSPKDADFYSYDATTKTLKKYFKVAISNGLDWNDSYTKLYYIDSAQRQVFQYDFDVTSATVCKFKRNCFNDKMPF